MEEGPCLQCVSLHACVSLYVLVWSEVGLRVTDLYPRHRFVSGMSSSVSQGLSHLGLLQLEAGQGCTAASRR